MGEILIETENQDVIHRNINVNETETNIYTSEEVIYECTDDTSPSIMEGSLNG